MSAPSPLPWSGQREQQWKAGQGSSCLVSFFLFQWYNWSLLPSGRTGAGVLGCVSPGVEGVGVLGEGELGCKSFLFSSISANSGILQRPFTCSNSCTYGGKKESWRKFFTTSKLEWRIFRRVFGKQNISLAYPRHTKSGDLPVDNEVSKSDIGS